MPRIARIVVPEYPHHITQRGNYRQKIFSDDDDRDKYLSYIQKYSNEYGVSILAYCLMHNHVHFIAVPDKQDSLAKAFKAAHLCYSQYFNRKMKTAGHLWQGRFYSAVLDESHLISAARYIERNPVRAKIVKKPWQWEWSSAQANINQAKPKIRLKNLLELVGMSCNSWKQLLDCEEDAKTLDNIRKHTLTGRPLGASAFIEKLEKRFGKRMHALTIGRPKKKK